MKLIKKIEKLNIEKKLNNVLKTFLIIASIFIIPSLISKLLSFIINSDNVRSLISNLLYLLLLIGFFYKSFIEEFKIFKENYKNCIKTGLKYWILGLIGMIISNLIINIIIFKGNIAANEEIARGVMIEYPLYAIISAVIIAPFIEELIFRKSIRMVFDNKIVYAVVSGIIFGLMHAAVRIDSMLNLLYIIPYGSLGFAFALAYHKTKTIFTSIFLHMLHNAVTVALIFIVL